MVVQCVARCLNVQIPTVVEAFDHTSNSYARESMWPLHIMVTSTTSNGSNGMEDRCILRLGQHNSETLGATF